VTFASGFRVDPSSDPPGDGRRSGHQPPSSPVGEGDDLAYKVELWDSKGNLVEQTVAVTSSASIGFAAYYAATREFPDATITLRHKNNILSRWGGKPH
jgi:hypothetical protein